MKKWLALIMAVCMMLVSVPAMASQADAAAASSRIGDGLYLAQTPLYGSSASKLHNIELAVNAVNGSMIYEDEEFSFNSVVGPRTKEMGYVAAKNGRGVEVQGGGVSQVATTLYLALRDAADVTINPFGTYEDDFAEWYVEDGYDAVITDYDRNRDFSFVSSYDGAICIDMWMDESYVYCLLTFDEDGQRRSQIARSSTPIFGSANKEYNIVQASDALNGVILEFGDTFSFNELVGPRTKEAGFRSAENGRGVKVYGGGVAQVASTVYLAVKELDCVAVDPVKTYGKKFVDGYVADADDAIITDYNAGTDFSFTYWGDGTMLILVYQDGERLVCEVYEF